jgi:hypothetical protein
MIDKLDYNIISALDRGIDEKSTVEQNVQA